MELKRAVKGGLGEQDCPFGFEDGTDEALQLGVRAGCMPAWVPGIYRMGHTACSYPVFCGLWLALRPGQLADPCGVRALLP